MIGRSPEKVTLSEISLACFIESACVGVNSNTPWLSSCDLLLVGFLYVSVNLRFETTQSVISCALLENKEFVEPLITSISVDKDLSGTLCSSTKLQVLFPTVLT